MFLSTEKHWQLLGSLGLWQQAIDYTTLSFGPLGNFLMVA